MPDSTPTMKVFAGIAAAMRHFAEHGVGKGGVNREQNYKFRGIDDLLNAASAALTHAKLVYVPHVQERIVTHGTTAKGTAFVDVALRVQYDIYSTEDGSMLPSSSVIYAEGRDYADKATNKALSAALKYFLTQLFCIPFLGVLDEGDAETIEGARDEAKPEKKSAPQFPEVPNDALADKIFEELSIATPDLMKTYKAQIQRWPSGHPQRARLVEAYNMRADELRNSEAA